VCRSPTGSAKKGIGFKIAMAGLDGGRINIAACSLGGAQSALDKSLAYMKERKAFGKRLDEFQRCSPARRHGDRAGSGADFVWRAARARPQGCHATWLCAWPSGFGTMSVSRWPIRRCSCMALWLFSEYGIEKSYAICACIRSSKAQTRSCGLIVARKADRGHMMTASSRGSGDGYAT